MNIEPLGEQAVGSVQDAADLARRLRERGCSIVQCHGVFDLLHPGHVEHLEEAKGKGDVLVVTITPDRYVNKGPGRPVFTQDHRARLLSALATVDFVAVTESPTATDAIRAIRPDTYVKGPDYADHADDITGNIRAEEKAVIDGGGVVHYTSGPTSSSSALINRHLGTHGPTTENWLQGFRARHSELEITEWLESIQDLNVLVVGEAIFDEYVRCEALGKSSKDPVLAFREINHQRHLGGSLAIAAHCSGLGARVTSVFRVGENPDDLAFIKESISESLRIDPLVSTSQPTIVKRRYLDEVTEARVFETYVMADDPITDREDADLQSALEAHANSADIVLVADYGHGLLSPLAIETLTSCDTPLAVNTQSNAGNRGFNTISRYPHPEFVCLNGSEVSLELRRRHLTLEELVPQLRERTSAQRAMITEGPNGLICCDTDGAIQHIPAFADSVRDRVGAGDALFAVTSLLFALGAPPDVSGFFGNLAGAAAVAQLGNESPLSSQDLSRHAAVLMK